MEPNLRYVSAGTVQKYYDVSASSLRAWADEGKIRMVRTRNGTSTRLYLWGDVVSFFQAKPDDTPADITAAPEHTVGIKRRICYARVFSADRQHELEKQSSTLRRAYPGHELITDIGSGISWRRPGLLAILDAVCSGCVTEVVVTRRDRIARLDTELLIWLFKRHNTKLVVLDAPTLLDAGDVDEIHRDLHAVITQVMGQGNSMTGVVKRKRCTVEEDEDDGDERAPKRARSADEEASHDNQEQ